MFAIKRFLLAIGLPLALASSVAAQTTTTPAPAAAEKTVEVNRAAKVVLVEGDVSAFAASKQKRMLKVDDYLVEGDSIVTGKDGELHLDMEDGGYISVRPNTKMRIVKYQAKGEDSDTGVFGLLQGSFRSVTGWIGKFNRDKYTVRTPAATIGIRGTDHEPYVIPKGSSEGEPGTYDKVNEGGSFIQTQGGRAEVAPNQSGFVSHDKTAKPRVLKDVPRHFRAGRHERLFPASTAKFRSALRNAARTAVPISGSACRTRKPARRRGRRIACRPSRKNARPRKREGSRPKLHARMPNQRNRASARSMTTNRKRPTTLGRGNEGRPTDRGTRVL